MPLPAGLSENDEVVHGGVVQIVKGVRADGGYVLMQKLPNFVGAPNFPTSDPGEAGVVWFDEAAGKFRASSG